MLIWIKYLNASKPRPSVWIIEERSTHTEFKSTLKEGELAVDLSSEMSVLLESTRTKSTPSCELTDTKMFLDFDANSERYFVPVIVNWSPVIFALVLGFSGSCIWDCGS